MITQIIKTDYADYVIRFFLIFLFMCLIFTGNNYAEEDDWAGTFSTKFSRVFYERGVDLNGLNRVINLKFPDFYNVMAGEKKPDLEIEDILSNKIDSIFSKVQDVLDMHPKRIYVTINVYKTREALDRVYEGFFNEPNHAISFYIYKTNTIYTLESAINERLLSHEIAHCIIDHYFVVLPPEKVQEILAVYADVHLKE